MSTPPLGPSVKLPRGQRSAVLGGGNACENRHWGLRWGSRWGHVTLCWVGVAHAGGATGAFGGAPYGATKRCTDLGWRMRAPPMGPS
eukprot:7041482-Pyramimonas_sp.AAC.1